MKINIAKNTRDVASIIVPKKVSLTDEYDFFGSLRIAVIIPTYKPSYTTKALVENLNEWYENVEIIVVDDSAGKVKGRYEDNFLDIDKLSDENPRIHYIKSPKNLHKSGALNCGFEYVKKMHRQNKINVVVTTDDDVVVTRKTIPTLVNKLYSSLEIGAACSTVRVRNKNRNLLTRLQGLEYHNFNVTKLSDNGFFKGPLVMQGMISAFKISAFLDVGGFSVDNLIEDYEMTANLKKHGWSVVFVPECWAWTDVPYDLGTLRKQRIRWTYWGLEVIGSYFKSFVPVIQDVIGHMVFSLMIILIALSFMIPSAVSAEKPVIVALFGIAFIQFAVSYLFGIYTLKKYKDADWKDHAVRLVIVPEMIYGNIMSMVLFGSYLYYGFNMFFKKGERFNKVYTSGAKVFARFGYLLTWGTRDLAVENIKGGGNS